MTDTGEAWNYFRPIFARGKTNTKTATGTYSDGDNVFTLNNAGGEFVVDDFIFAAVDDGTLPVYLGQVTAATVGAITTRMSLSGGFLTSTIDIWEPTLYWRPAWGIARILISPIDWGVNTRDLGNGQIQNTKVADASNGIDVSLEMDGAGWLDFVTFFGAAAGWNTGLNNVTFAWFDQKLTVPQLQTVNRIMDPQRIVNDQAKDLIRDSHRLRTIAAGVYAT